MASIVLGSIVTDARGKIGNEVYSRNSAGPYVRSVGTWSQPDTDRQTDCRATIASLSQYWSATLSEAQREGWRGYAAQHPTANIWGHPVVNTGYLSFIRHNAHWWRQAEGIRSPNAPGYPPLHQSPHDLVAHYSNNKLWVSPLPRASWNVPGSLICYCFAGLQRTAGVNFFNAPWRFAGVAYASDSAWSSTPLVFDYPSGPAEPPPAVWPVLTEAQKVWTYVVIQSWEHGCMSPPHQESTIVVY